MSDSKPSYNEQFAPHFSIYMAKKISQLLISREVQGIHFHFGSVVVSPDDFRTLSGRFDKRPYHDGLSGLRVVINPAYLASLREYGDDRPIIAAYLPNHDAFYFREARFARNEYGKGIVVHECVHAAADLRGKTTAARSEEGAAEVARAWYHLATGSRDSAHKMADVIWEVAEDLRARKPGKAAVSMKASQINAVRLEMAKKGVENGYYAKNGVSGG